MEGLKLIATKYTADRQKKSDLLKSNQAELAQKQTELESLQKETTQLESWLNQEKTKAQSQASILMKEIAETEEAEKQLAGLRETLDDIEQRLAKRDFAITEQEALAAIETELASLGYDSEKHEQVRQQLSQLEPYDHDKQKLEEAERLISQEKEAVARAEEAAQGLQDSLKLDNQKKEALTAELTSAPPVAQRFSRSRSRAPEPDGTAEPGSGNGGECEGKNTALCRTGNKKERERRPAVSGGQRGKYL